MSALILIIEDNAASLELMQYLLRAFGHRTLAASDGLLGCSQARHEQPDLILCDVDLPLLDGFGVLQNLRAGMLPLCSPVLAVTAHAMLGDRERLLGAGFDGYICKPIEPEAFVGQVEAYLTPSLRSPQLRHAADDPGAGVRWHHDDKIRSGPRA